MCGITGILAFTEKGRDCLPKINASVKALQRRGPDGEGIFVHRNIALAHRRLAIIDTSASAAQPFTDHTGRYTVIYNGEFFNFKHYREELIQKKIPLKSNSDTEVLLYMYMEEGPACLEKINGFFALAIYDNVSEELFIARDRYGIKPLLFFQDGDYFAFASELKALLMYDIPKVLDEFSLFTYLQLNYIPSPHSVLKNVCKIQPGHYILIRNKEINTCCYYKIPYQEFLPAVPDYLTAQNQLSSLLDEAVQKRLISDVPLGCFLSGGIDSSVITALAARHTPHLKTFSIGYRDEPLFDETEYAILVAKKLNTDHTVFSLCNDDLLGNLFQVLDYLDEPFADSSALAVHILSMHTRKHATVALSGDGADELFAGYTKHAAEFRIRYHPLLTSLMGLTSPLWSVLPKSRNSIIGNKVRQLQKFSEGTRLSLKDRYWSWAGFASETAVHQLVRSNTSSAEYSKRKDLLLQYLNPDFNSVLLTDMNLVLQNDMLTKVDTMSMANSLEVRVPFLDYSVVNFAFTLPASYKIADQGRKLILKDAFRSQLPVELWNRPKHGFEVPLLKWLRTDLKSLVMDDLLSENLIHEQGLFEYKDIQILLNQLFSKNPGDAAARIWGLVVFQYWWKKYMR